MSAPTWKKSAHSWVRVVCLSHYFNHKLVNGSISLQGTHCNFMFILNSNNIDLLTFCVHSCIHGYVHSYVHSYVGQTINQGWNSRCLYIDASNLLYLSATGYKVSG